MCLRVLRELGKLGCGGISLDHFDPQEQELFVWIFICKHTKYCVYFLGVLIFVIAFFVFITALVAIFDRLC